MAGSLYLAITPNDSATTAAATIHRRVVILGSRMAYSWKV